MGEDLTDSLADLVVRAQNGDAEAYDTLYQRFKDMAFSYAYSVLGDYGLAEDARQDAFLRAYCDLVAVREPAAFPGWFRQVVVSHSLTLRRRRKVLTVPLENADGVADAAEGPAALAQQREERDWVLREVERLPPGECEAVRLYHLEDLSLRRVAERTGLDEVEVRRRLHSGRERLRQRMVQVARKDLQHRKLSGNRAALQGASEEAVASFDAELQNLMRVPSESEQQRAGDLLCAKGRMLRFLGKGAEALESFEGALGVPFLKRNPVWRARFRAEIGLTCVQISQYDRARKELRAARSLLQKTQGPPLLLAAVLNGLGLCAWGAGEYRKARPLYRAAADLAGEHACPEIEAEALNNLALLEWKSGRAAEALEQFKAVLRTWKKLRNRFAHSLVLMNIGILEEGLGRGAVARARYEEALHLARELRFAQLEGACQGNLASLCLNEEAWAPAADHADQALAVAERIGDRRSQAIALENLALARLGLGQAAEAESHLKAGRRTATAIGDRERLFSLDLVEVESRLGRSPAAGLLRRLDALRKTLVAKGYLSELPRLLRLRLHALAPAATKQEALKAVQVALRECRRQKNLPEEQRVLALKKKMVDGRK